MHTYIDTYIITYMYRYRNLHACLSDPLYLPHCINVITLNNYSQCKTVSPL